MDLQYKEFQCKLTRSFTRSPYCKHQCDGKFFNFHSYVNSLLLIPLFISRTHCSHSSVSIFLSWVRSDWQASSSPRNPDKSWKSSLLTSLISSTWKNSVESKKILWRQNVMASRGFSSLFTAILSSIYISSKRTPRNDRIPLLLAAFPNRFWPQPLACLARHFWLLREC